MRKKSVTAVWIILTLLCIAFPASAMTLKLSSTAVSLGLTPNVNDTTSLSATVSPVSKSADVVWKSWNEDVVLVSQEGELQAMSYGVAKVTATLGSKKTSCVVKVTKKPVVSIKLNKSKATLYIGRSSLQLKYVMSPKNPDNPVVEWNSSNPSVAFVTQDGEVIPIGTGKATIWCAATDGSNKKAKCVVTVKNVVPIRVILSEKTLQMMEGGMNTLNCAVLPTDATIQDVKWSSSNPKVVSVDRYGNLTAYGKGKATITCKTVSGGKIAKCAVTVNTIVPTKLTLAQSAVRIIAGSTYTLQYSILPADAINKNVKWASSDTKVASVDANGVVTAHKAGAVTIACKTVEGGKTAKCVVSVYTIRPDSVSMSASMKLQIGSTEQMNYTILPENTVNKSVTWSSSDSNVVSVDANGFVTGRKIGTANITCKTVESAKTATCAVSVGFFETTFRAMVIGQKEYKNASKLYSSPYDAQIMEKLLENSTLTGKNYTKVDKRANLTYASLLAALDDMADWGTKENDVTVFFYSGHGSNYNGTSWLLGTDYSSAEGNRVSISTVKQKLDKLKGRVIIVLDCCYSGGMVNLMSKGEATGSPEQFDADVIKVFSSALQSKGTTPVYYVLTACRSTEESYTDNGEYKQGSFFTRYLGEGAGYTTTNGKLSSMAADTNKDGMCSVSELYTYTKPRVQKKLNTYFDEPGTVTQTVMVYPTSSAIPLIGRN